MALEKWNIMGNNEDDDCGRVIVPGNGPEMPADEDAGERPEIGEDKPEVQIEPPPKEDRASRLPPPPPEEAENIIKQPKKQKLPN